jgi:hypothetical protein
LNGIQEVSGSTPLSSTIRPSPQNGGGLFIWGGGVGDLRSLRLMAFQNFL